MHALLFRVWSLLMKCCFLTCAFSVVCACDPSQAAKMESLHAAAGGRRGTLFPETVVPESFAILHSCPPSP